VTIIASKEQIIWDLESYGEFEAAAQIDDLDDEQFAKLRELAFLHAIHPDGPMIAKACALGAIEFLEGAVRPLKRQRRKTPDWTPKSDPDLMMLAPSVRKTKT